MNVSEWKQKAIAAVLIIVAIIGGTWAMLRYEAGACDRATDPAQIRECEIRDGVRAQE